MKKIYFLLGFIILMLLSLLLLQNYSFFTSIFKAKEITLTKLDFTPLLNKNLIFTPNKDDTKINRLLGIKGKIPLNSENFSDAKSAGTQFLKEYGEYFGVKDSQKNLQILSTKIDKLGKQHLRYEQKYNNIPVFGGEMLIHFDKDNSVKSATGKILDNISSLSSKTKYTQKQAQTTVSAAWKKIYKNSKPTVLAPKLYVFNPSFINSKQKNTNYLTWKVDIVDTSSGKREFFFVDANTNKIVYRLDGTKTLTRMIYDCSNTDNNCVSARVEGGRTYNNQDIDDAYNFLKDSHDYFQEKLNINGANKEGGLSVLNLPGFDLGLTVSYNRAIMRNEDGDNICPNACWYGAGVEFCDNVVTRNVVGHEYMHAVTDFNGPAMIYEGESGAIDEAYSDIFGAAIDNYISPTNNWDNQWRDIDNPSNTNNPDTYFSASFSCIADDNFGVHQNSTVLSHAAYLLTNGGNFNGCKITAISRHEMELILLNALVYFLPQNPTFNEFYDAVSDSCDDLYNLIPNGNYLDPVCREVRKAFQAAMIDQTGGRCALAGGMPIAKCIPPNIINVSSPNRNTLYSNDAEITIDVYFSKKVSSDRVTVKLALDDGVERSCSFSINNNSKGSCVYKVMEGDNSRDLNVKEILGNIVDENLTPITNFTPDYNLADNKNIVVDTEIPTLDSSRVNTDEIQNDYNFSQSPSPSFRLNDDINIPDIISSPLISPTPSFDLPEIKEFQPLPKFTPSISPLPSTKIPSKEPALSKIPEFDVSVTNNKTKFNLKGKISSFGTKENCLEALKENPIIIYWNDGTTSRPTIEKDLSFSAEHTYTKQNHSTYEISVKVTNSCYGSYSHKIPVNPF